MPLRQAHREIEKLKDALAYAEAVIDAINESLVVLYPDLTIRNANQKFYKTFKVTPEKAEQKLIYELDNGQWNIPELKIFLEKTLRTKTSYNDYEITIPFKKIGKKIMLFNARKIIMGGEKKPMILMVIEDITDKKRYEQQAEKEKNILAENQRLQDISRQKDDFISMASHELKTPVTSIKAFAQLLEQDFADLGNAKAAKMLSRMNLQIVKLTSLIGDLLDISRIAGGKLQYHLSYFDFNEMLQDTVREMQLTTKIHKINLSVIEAPPVFGDKDRISQVLTNLLSNAIKYSPRADTIDVSTCIDEEIIRVCVRDYGIGIGKEKQDKIFERFFRVNGAKEDTYPGLGLGLYISSEIIKRHGGCISVQSNKSRGSTFCFEIPVEGS